MEDASSYTFMLFTWGHESALPQVCFSQAASTLNFFCLPRIFLKDISQAKPSSEGSSSQESLLLAQTHSYRHILTKPLTKELSHTALEEVRWAANPSSTLLFRRVQHYNRNNLE